MEVGGVDGAAPAVVEQGGVDDGGVGGEGHAAGEAVDEDSGDQGALGVLADLLFDEGGQDDGAGDVLCIFGCQAELGGLLAEAVDHGGEDLLGRGVAGEAVGVGEEIAFEGGGGGVLGVWKGAMSSVWRRSAARKASREPRPADCDCLGDVEDVVALGDGEGDGVDVAAGDAGVDLGGGGGVVEAVLAGLEGAAFAEAEQSKA